MIEIKLRNNNGFKWFSQNNIHVKGYIFDEKNNLLEKEEFVNFLLEIKDFNYFRKTIERLNGIFSIIINIGDKIFLSTDITRTIPLFYTNQNNNWIISDDANFLKNTYSLSFLEDSEIEFLLTGYVTGKKTLVKNLYQVQAAEVVCLDKQGLKEEEYWNYNTNETVETSFENLQIILYNTYQRVLKRLIDSVKNRTIVIPLSGGYDSRLIVALLLKYNYTNIVCFTYGDTKAEEIIIATEVAKKLKIKLITISYDEKFFKNTFDIEEVKNYIKFAGNLVSLSHIQDLFAIKYLKNNALIPDDSIFVPGHSADIFAGSHISKKITNKVSHTLVKNEIRKKHFSLNENLKDITIKYDEKKFGYSNMEAWSWKERQSKFIVNSLKVYEYYGYESRLPFWDKELAEFFRYIPLKYKNRNNKLTYSIENNLYDSVSFKIFDEYNISIKKKNNLTFIQKVFIVLKRNLLKGNIKDINNLDYVVKKLSKIYDIKISNNINGVLSQIILKIFKDK